MSDAEKSHPSVVASSSAEVADPDGKNDDPPPQDESSARRFTLAVIDGEIHSGPHHDESLRPYQRTIIWMIAPSFLSNVPHPWPAFLCLGFLHVGLFVASFFFFQANCHNVEHFGAEQVTYYSWQALVADRDYGVGLSVFRVCWCIENQSVHRRWVGATSGRHRSDIGVTSE